MGSGFCLLVTVCIGTVLVPTVHENREWMRRMSVVVGGGVLLCFVVAFVAFVHDITSSFAGWATIYHHLTQHHTISSRYECS